MLHSECIDADGYGVPDLAESRMSARRFRPASALPFLLFHAIR